MESALEELHPDIEDIHIKIFTEEKQDMSPSLFIFYFRENLVHDDEEGGVFQ